MTHIKELPPCQTRYGRTEIVENGDKKAVKLIIACGYREVDPEECIVCQGFKNAKLEFKIHTFIKMVRRK